MADPIELVTVTPLMPVVLAEVVPVSVVEFCTAMPVSGAPPMLAVVSAEVVKFVPVIVTCWPPAAARRAG